MQWAKTNLDRTISRSYYDLMETKYKEFDSVNVENSGQKSSEEDRIHCFKHGVSSY